MPVFNKNIKLDFVIGNRARMQAVKRLKTELCNKIILYLCVEAKNSVLWQMKSKLNFKDVYLRQKKVLGLCHVKAKPFPNSPLKKLQIRQQFLCFFSVNSQKKLKKKMFVTIKTSTKSK